MKKKIIVLGLIALLLSPVIAFAATNVSNSYTNYLHLPPNVQVEGKSRSYQYSNHKIDIDIEKIYDAALEKRVIISLNKKNLIGSSQKKRVTIAYELGGAIHEELGNHGKGNFWYGFGSYDYALMDGGNGHGAAYAGIDTQNVTMTSYK